MSTADLTAPAPHVGDQVILRGTRVVGHVACVEDTSDQGWVSVRVTEVLGKSYTSKTARAWRGALLTCVPSMVSTLTPATH